MTPNRHLQIISGHAKAVIRNTDQILASPGGDDLDPVGLSIYGIFHQFLDDTGRPFDHLACGDLVDGGFVQLFYNGGTVAHEGSHMFERAGIRISALFP